MPVGQPLQPNSHETNSNKSLTFRVPNCVVTVQLRRTYKSRHHTTLQAVCKVKFAFIILIASRCFFVSSKAICRSQCSGCVWLSYSSGTRERWDLLPPIQLGGDREAEAVSKVGWPTLLFSDCANKPCLPPSVCR